MRTAIVHRVLLAALLMTNTLWALPAPAEESGLRGPVMGYAFDAATQTVRPVNGIPGSSLLGRPLDLPFPIAAAVFSATGNFGLVTSAADTRATYLLGNLDGTANLTPIEGAINADSMFFNVNSSAAALLTSDARQLQVLRGLPVTPTVGPVIDLSSISGKIAALAIDRSAVQIVIATSADDGAVYLVSADGQSAPRLIASFGSPAALALVHGDQDLIVADAAVNEITLLRNFGGTPEPFVLAGARDGIAGPSGLWAAPDDRKIYIANRDTRTLAIWNFDSQAIEASFLLDAVPTRVRPLQGSSLFALNDIGDHPLLLLDADVNPAVYFVPADRDR